MQFDFMNYGYTIRFKQKDVAKFVNWANENGYRWGGGSTVNEFNVTRRLEKEEEFCLTARGIHKTEPSFAAGPISTHKGFCEMHGKRYKVVSFPFESTISSFLKEGRLSECEV